MISVSLETDKIVDWDSFHDECIAVFGFSPHFYHRDMGSWMNCLTYLPEGDGLSRFRLAKGQCLYIHIPSFSSFAKRVPEICAALLDSVATVNQRYIEGRDSPRLVLVLE